MKELATKKPLLEEEWKCEKYFQDIIEKAEDEHFGFHFLLNETRIA